MSITPRGVPYQVSALDVDGVLRQFGFESATLVGEGLGCVMALVVAAWYPDHVGRLILLAPKWESLEDSIEARALHECPPDLRALRARVRCQVIEAQTTNELQATLP
jgi:pimeloyl-ACP methyl ester carboxylesterase